MKKITILILLVSTILGLYSQNLCKIQIIDEKGEAIPFVNVSISDGKGLTSDANGQFVLDKEICNSSVLSFSHIAFKARQINISTISDTIHLKPQRHNLKEIVVSNINIRKILATALSNVNYNGKRNYFSTRFMAIGDSLVFYTEKSFKLMKVEAKKIKTKTYSDIYYNASPNRVYDVNFPFVATLSRNPYWVYKSKEKFNELVVNAFIEEEYDSFYKVRSLTDSTDIIMYVSKLNKRLLRYEKTIAPFKVQSTEIDTTRYSYEFGLENKNTIIIKSFKLQTVIYDKVESKLYATRTYISDILVKKTVSKDSLSFSSLKELKTYKKNQELIDVGLYNFFHKSQLSKKNTTKESASNMKFEKFPINYVLLRQNKSEKGNIFLPMSSYLTLYDKSLKKYQHYPVLYQKTSINKSPDFIEHYNKKLKKDSFNPYGVKDPQTSVYMGVINSLLRKIQKD